MKKIYFIIAAAFMMSLLVACSNDGGNGDVDDEVVPADLTYEISEKSYEESFTSDDKEIAYYSFTFPQITPSDERGKEIADGFNEYFESLAQEKIEEFKSTVYENALASYNEIGAEQWGDKAYTQTITFEAVKCIDYIAITFDTTTTEEESVPGFFCRMYDMKNGGVFELRDLSDTPDELVAAVAADIMTQLQEQELTESLYEDYSERVSQMEGAEMYFSEDGLVVTFPTGTLGPKEAGMPCLLVDYPVIDSYLNDFALSLLYEFTGVVG